MLRDRQEGGEKGGGRKNQCCLKAQEMKIFGEKGRGSSTLNGGGGGGIRRIGEGGKN